MTTLYLGAKVYTGEGQFAQAFAVRDGRFVFAGSDEEAAVFPADERVDLGGGFVCCGFNDSHMHLLNYGSYLINAPLTDHTDSLCGMIDFLRGFAAEHPRREGEWLVGRGWNHDSFTDEHRLPDRHDLDRVSADVPVCAVRCCGHCLAVNSIALKLLGVTADTPQPDGGEIGVTDGEPNGLFFDNAMDMVYSAIPAPSKEALKDMIRLSCHSLNALGITSCHSDDYSIFRNVPWQTVKQAFDELEASGELSVRVYEQSNVMTPEALRELIAAGFTTGTGTARFRNGPLKMLGDGSLGARTAYLSQPYSDDPSVTGFPCYDQRTMDSMIGSANEHGMQVAVHAIGDKCLDMVLDAIEKALRAHPRKDHRHGIVHCQITREDQLQRIADMGLHVYAQPIFLDYDNRIVLPRVGKERAETSYRWKTLMKRGVSVSAGTDCPVEMPDPMRCLQCAVTRTTLDGEVGPYLPEEAFTAAEAIDSYTIRSAEAAFEEDEKGLIRSGYLADFVLLDQDPFSIPASDIASIRVKGTWLGGERIYTAPQG